MLPFVLAVACRTAPPPASSPQPPAVAAAPADSMVLAVSDTEAVWLAEGRTASDSAGRSCVERSVEIRRPGARVKVPLLFVRSAPTRLDRDRLRAELSLRCRVMAIYAVEIATGRPIKLEDR